MRTYALAPFHKLESNKTTLFLSQKTGGVLSVLDEECIRPGEATMVTLLNKMNDKFLAHPHYECKLARGASPAFTLKHYAGNVTYDLDAFIDKNKDLLYKDLIFAMGSSKNSVIKCLFPENKKEADLKRPPSAGSQFKVFPFSFLFLFQLFSLLISVVIIMFSASPTQKSMQSLMDNLMSKTPHYIRCIKSNEEKEAGEFNDQLCLHQVRYLG